MAQRPSHPSLRPIRTIEIKGRPVWNIPDDGYVTPRLRLPMRTNAIGFTVRSLVAEDDAADE